MKALPNALRWFATAPGIAGRLYGWGWDACVLGVFALALGVGFSNLQARKDESNLESQAATFPAQGRESAARAEQAAAWQFLDAADVGDYRAAILRAARRSPASAFLQDRLDPAKVAWNGGAAFADLGENVGHIVHWYDNSAYAAQAARLTAIDISLPVQTRAASGVSAGRRSAPTDGQSVHPMTAKAAAPSADQSAKAARAQTPVDLSKNLAAGGTKIVNRFIKGVGSIFKPRSPKPARSATAQM